MRVSPGVLLDMNICMFTNTYWPHVGGVARSVVAFREDLKRLGHRVLVVAPRYSLEEEGAQDQEEDVLRLPAVQNFNGSDFSLRIPVPFVIEQKIKAFGPHVIHSHHPYLLGDSAIRTARKHALPVVFTHHTMYEKYTHYVPGSSQTMKRFVVALSTEYANLCDRVVAPSGSIMKLLKQRGVTTPTVEIPTGVDVGFFEAGDGRGFRKALGLGPEVFLIGHVGRLAPEKNLAFLSRALSRVVKERPEAHFLVVGAGPSAGAMECAFRAQGVEERITMAGERTGRALAHAYRSMDLFVFASQSETQGMVLTEAMAAGNPVVALDAPGVREVVKDRQNGRLLPAGASEEEFAAAVLECVDRDTERKQWREAARSTAGQFARQACAQKLLAVYRSVAAPRNSSRHRGELRDDLAPWEKLLQGIGAEWELLSQKAAAAVSTLGGNEGSESSLR